MVFLVAKTVQLVMYTNQPSKLIVLKYLSLPFTLFIMNSKINLRKNSSIEYFKIISHYFRVYSLSGFI